jgi:hypothetical protein
MNRITKLLAVTGISGILALGVAGVAQASPDHGAQGGSPSVSKVDRSGSSRDHGGSKDHSGSKDHGKKHDGKSKDHGKNHK